MSLGAIAAKNRAAAIRLELADFVGQFYDDPLGFVLAAYPWGEPGGPLEKQTGPDTWQRQFLTGIGAEVRRNDFNGIDPVDPLRRTTSSGHGIGKSALVAWLVDWIMSTRPMCQGSVTANTFTQLETKTWAAIRAWTRLCLTGSWFRITDRRMFHPAFPDKWFCGLQASRETNSEAFAGQHAATSTSFYIGDEASTLARKIAEVMEGGMTDGEPMAFWFGNPTKSDGVFYENTFGRGRDKWHPTIVDSRTSKLTNKKLLEEWREEHGEDSDFYRVRVRGLPPNASDLQFIGTATVAGAMRREIALLGDEPLVCGLDLARGGGDKCVLWFRRGSDARSIPPVVIKGADSRDSMKVAAVVATAIAQRYDGRKVAATFVDASGGSVGGPIADRLRQLNYENVFDIQFGGSSPDRRYHDMRSYMWGVMRDWLRGRGAVLDLPELETDLTGPGYLHDANDAIKLESKESMKKRGIDSPDYGDALALTFAMPVEAIAESSSSSSSSSGGYQPRSAWG